MADPVASVHQEYASTHARLHRSKQLVRKVNTAHWVYRLAYNAAAEAERSFSRHRARQLNLGREPPRRPTSFEHDVALKNLRVHDQGGPVFEEAVSFPVTMLRAATREVHDATTATIKRWAKGQRSSIPRFRSARDAQTIKLSAFSIRRMESHQLAEGMYGPPVPPFWREHPTATFVVKGIGKLKARLSRPLPEGHVPVELHLTRDADGHVSLAIVSRGPVSRKAVDTEAVAQSIHEAVRHLATEAPNHAYVDAARVAGLIVRGADVGLLAPLCTDQGLATLPVRRTRAEVEALKEHQKLEAKRKRGEKRSAGALKAHRRAARVQRKVVNRRRTRAYQDAAMLVRGQNPGEGRGNPFVRPHANGVDAGAGGAHLVAMERRTVEQGVVAKSAVERDTAPEAWQRRRARAMNRRTAETGMNLRIRRSAHLCWESGTLWVEVEPGGTTRECSGCGADVPKGLGVRIHECPHCGLVLDRDVNAGVNIVGRALRQFRESADPGGRRALAAERAARAEVRRVRKLQARSKGGRTRARHAEGRSGPGVENQDEAQ